MNKEKELFILRQNLEFLIELRKKISNNKSLFLLERDKLRMNYFLKLEVKKLEAEINSVLSKIKKDGKIKL